MSAAPPIPAILVEQLDRLRSRLKGVSAAGGIGTTLWVTAICFAAALLVDIFLPLPVWARGLITFSVLLAGAGVALWRVVRPLTQQIETDQLAALVEGAYPELNERLLASLELSQAAARGEPAGSPVMRRWLLTETVNFARQHDFADSVNGDRAVRNCWLGGIAFFILLLPFVFAASSYSLLISRFVNPWGNYERVQNLQLNVLNGDFVVPRGTDITLQAEVGWRFFTGTPPESAWLEWTTDQGTSQRRRMDWNPEQQVYAVVLPRVEHGFTYRVTSQGSQSRNYRVGIVDPPELIEFSAEVVPPAYTGEPARQFPAVAGELQVLEQSRLELNARFRQPVVNAEIVWLDRTVRSGKGERQPQITPLQLSSDGLSATWESTIALDALAGRFFIRGTDAQGFSTPEAGIVILTIEPDRAPQITLYDVANEFGTIEARPDDRLTFEVDASDDFGLATVELHYSIARAGGVKESGMLATPSDQLTARRLAQPFVLDLAEFELPQGTVVTVRGRATDSRPVPGPNESWSSERQILIQENARPPEDAQLAQRQQQMEQVLDRLRSELDRMQNQAKQLQSQAKADAARQREWQRDDETRSLQQKLDDVAEQLQNLEALFDQQQGSDSLAERTRQVLDQLNSAQQAVDQAQQASLRDKPQPFGEAAEQLRQASQKLNQVEQAFRDITNLQRDLLELNRLATNTERLADKVDRLTKEQQAASEKSESNEERRRQAADHRQVVGQHQQLEQQLSQLTSRRPELKGTALEQLQRQLSDLADNVDGLNQRQNELSDAISDLDLADDPARALEEIRQQQSELQQQSANAAEEFNKAVDELKSPAINASEQARQAQQASQRLQEAEKKMTEAAEQLEQENVDPAQSSQQQAAQKLDSAAMAARRSSELSLPPNNPHLPAEVGQQVANASRQLTSVGKQLEQLGPPPESASSESSTASGEGQSSRGQNAGQELAESLRQAAQNFRQAANEMGVSPSSSSGRGAFGEGGEPGDGGDRTGAAPNPSLNQLELNLGRISTRDWGKLPGKLNTELLEAAQRKPTGDYAPLIRKYFDEISKSRPPEMPAGP